MSPLSRSASMKSTPPDYDDLELGNMPTGKTENIKFHKTGSTFAGPSGYRDYQAGAPHDPSHVGPPQEAPQRKSRTPSPSWLRQSIAISKCHLITLYALLGILITFLALYMALLLPKQNIDIHNHIEINDDVTHQIMDHTTTQTASPTTSIAATDTPASTSTMRVAVVTVTPGGGTISTTVLSTKTVGPTPSIVSSTLMLTASPQSARAAPTVKPFEGAEVAGNADANDSADNGKA